MRTCKECGRRLTSGRSVYTYDSDATADPDYPGWCNRCVHRAEVARAATYRPVVVTPPAPPAKPASPHLSLEACERVMKTQRTVEIAFYDPQVDPGGTWLWLHTPRGSRRLSDPMTEDELKAYVDQVNSELEGVPQLLCDHCGTALPRSVAPAGDQYCVKCYSTDRKLRAMVWQGETVRNALAY